MKRLFTLIASLLLVCCGTAIAQEYVATPVTVSKEKVRLNGKVYLSHVVLEKQTLYGIAKAYGVSEDDLYEANPSLRETGLQKNAILLVPFRDNSTAAADSPQEPSYTEHSVRWYEDIDDIARRYNVTVREIMEFNNLQTRKLSTRQILKIPVKGNAVSQDNPEPAQDTDNSLADEGQSGDNPSVAPVEENVDTTILRLRSHDAVEFSLILPLHTTPGGSVSEVNMDFYSGVLMALKDLEAENMKVKMHVYDLSAGLPTAEALYQSDFVLGPVASRDLEAVLQRVNGRVPVISPLDQKAASLANYYKNFIQVPSATENQYDDLAQWVQEDLAPEDRIIFITEKGASNVTASVSIRSAMARRDLNYEILNYAIVEGRGIPNTLAGLMDKAGTNRIVVASESEAFIGDVVRNLGIMLGKGYKLVMYAPSKVRTFDTIEGSVYHDASLHISTAYHVDYSQPEVDRFVRSYRALFNTEPSQFVFQGYDTARFFVKNCAQYGYGWTNRLGWERGCGLHTDFLFRTNPENGNLYNTAVRRIVFQPNYTTTLQR